jgi:hypothetical protein
MKCLVFKLQPYMYNAIFLSTALSLHENTQKPLLVTVYYKEKKESSLYENDVFIVLKNP